MKRVAAVVAASVVGCTFSASALAAPPWVDRTLTLPSHDWAFDFGVGIAHDGNEPRDLTTPGLNAEFAVAPVDRLELGLRTGIRIGDQFDRFAQADFYGRPFDRQTLSRPTFNGDAAGYDLFANPEFRVRGELVRGDVVELGLEGRIDLPLAQDSHPGLLFGMPLWFHIGHRVRLDTGVYVPIVFDPAPIGTLTAISAPIDVWIQAAPRVWLGPESGFVLDTNTNRVAWSLGFGFGYQFTHALDLKAWLLFPDINHGDTDRDFGVGAGIQIRIE